MQATSKEETYKRPPGPDQQLKPLHYLQYYLVLGLQSAVNILPAFASRAMGRLIGWLFHAVDKRHRIIALKNMDQAFGDSKSEAEKRRLTRMCFLHYGQAILETLRLSKIRPDNYTNFVELDGVERFHEGLEMGKGVILCSAHYGNWEIMNTVLGILDLPMSVMARPIDNPLVHDYLEKIRVRTGNRVIYKHKGMRRVLTSLKENRVVGIVNDQDVHDHNRIMASFFGRDAATTPAPAALAYKTGAPIITGYSEPLGNGRYALKYGPLIIPNTEADKDEEIMRLTEAINRRLEAQIEHSPHSWMWMHQRFKTGVDGLTDFYKTPRVEA